LSLHFIIKIKSRKRGFVSEIETCYNLNNIFALMNFARKGLHGCCADVLLLTYWTTFRGVDTAPPL